LVKFPDDLLVVCCAVVVVLVGGVEVCGSCAAAKEATIKTQLARAILFMGRVPFSSSKV
jgi:hypothetical protein